MDSATGLTSAAIAARKAYEESRLAKEVEASRDFAKVLKEFDAYMDAVRKSQTESKAEKKSESDARYRKERINELRAIISKLREKLAISGYDPAVAAELAQFETQLFWLLMAI